MSTKQTDKTGRFSLSCATLLALVVGAAFVNLVVPETAQSQISSKVIKAPAFTQDRKPHVTRTKLPKAPAQVEMPAPPPIKIFPGLYEPLVATGPVTSEEGTDLDTALKAFHDAPAKAAKGSDYDDYGKPLLAFIDTHPNSNWNAALYLNIALGYDHSGYYSRVLPYLEKSWRLGRNATTPQAHMMIDRTAGEIAQMHAKLGHPGLCELVVIAGAKAGKCILQYIFTNDLPVAPTEEDNPSSGSGSGGSNTGEGNKAR